MLVFMTVRIKVFIIMSVIITLIILQALFYLFVTFAKCSVIILLHPPNISMNHKWLM